MNPYESDHSNPIQRQSVEDPQNWVRFKNKEMHVG
jgi:hypothetical protein